MSGSFKDLLNTRHVKEIGLDNKGSREIITDIDKITVPSTDATLEEAEQLWPLLEESLDTSKGYGLSAIQIGIAKKVAIIKYNGKVYRLRNTQIMEYGPTIIAYNEGCLSIPGKTVNTERAVSLTVKDDVLGQLKMDASKDGLLPLIVQHEVDHFNGKIIFDRVRKPVRKEKKLGRNDLCFCGSGKKYKKCCLATDI